MNSELKAKIESKDLLGAVEDYQQAAVVLDNYKEHPSFASIQKEVNEALDLLILKLYEPFEDRVEHFGIFEKLVFAITSRMLRILKEHTE